MKILLISAFIDYYKKKPFLLKSLYKFFSAHDLTTLHIASLTPSEYEVKIVDETFDNINLKDNYDLIGISCIRTAAAPHAYEIADEFRKRGKTVVLGGYHPSVLPEEAKEHADSVVIGEAEYIWPKLLEDYKQNSLKPFYQQDKPVDPRHIIKTDYSIENRCSIIASIQSTRGCPINCDFCSITNQKFGGIYRVRPIENVIEEIKTIPHKFIIFNESSLSINIEYTKKLLNLMKPLNKKFRCWMNANIPISDDKFLKVIKEAGCMGIEIGFESFSQNTINTIGKTTNKIAHYKELIKKFHDHGIAVGGTFIFGFDNDTVNIFDKTLENIYLLDLDFPRFAILTPFPGTPLFERLDSQGRILTKDWSKYDMVHVVFKPKNMTPEELYNGWERVCDDIYSTINIIKRVFSNENLKFYPWCWRLTSNILEWRA